MPGPSLAAPMPMINQCFIEHSLAMTPEGSLNRLPVSGECLHPRDPLLHSNDLTGSQLMSRQALIQLLTALEHPAGNQPREFITRFDEQNPADAQLLDILATRFATVINSARDGQHWPTTSAYVQRLTAHWQQAQTLVIAGGLTSGSFGIALAQLVEARVSALDIIASPWGGATALFGLAQTVSRDGPLLVMDFGATGIKRGIATKYGNRMELLPDLPVSPFKEEGLVRKAGCCEIFRQTRQALDEAMPVAISLACYLNHGHPFDYHSGIYHRLRDDAEHLAEALRTDWLPACGLSSLALLEHDSTSAAFAFRFKHPAMLITLGTGLGSAPCPSSSEPTTGEQ